MAEQKLNFYVGDISAGNKDGTKARSVQFTTPVFNDGNDSYLIKFALRCDEGYMAENVTISVNDSTGYVHTSGSYTHYRIINPNSNSSYALGGGHNCDPISLSKITDVNTVILFQFASITPSKILEGNFFATISVGYTEVKVP